LASWGASGLPEPFPLFPCLGFGFSVVVELHFRAYGQGEPLIIVHGLLGSLDNFHSISSKLSSDFKVFGLDLRNHGRSPHSFEMDYPLMAGDLKEFIENQGMNDAFVLGHSMGGKVAMQLALLYPEKVRKLIVADIAPRRYPPRHQKLLIGMASLDLNHFQSRKEMEAALAPAVSDLSTRQFLLKNAVREAEGFRWRIGLQEIIQNYEHLTEPLSSERCFEKPTLFMRGERSDFFLENDMNSVQELFPSAVLETIPGAGHLVHAENPLAFVNSVRAFLLDPDRH
jgi:pimeloyl-ACP methyl ester carboxylesterase